MQEGDLELNTDISSFSSRVHGNQFGSDKDLQHHEIGHYNF